MQTQIPMGLCPFVVMVLLVGGGGCGCVWAMVEARELTGEHRSKNGLFVRGERGMAHAGYGIEGRGAESSWSSERTSLLVGGLGYRNSIAVSKRKLGKEAPSNDESGEKQQRKKPYLWEEERGSIEKRKQQLNKKGAFSHEGRDVRRLRGNNTNGAVVEKEKHAGNAALQEGRATYKMSLYAGAGQFLTVLRIGTPPVSFTAIVDTGSDLVWRQCKPCKRCYPQSADTFPIFNPAFSSTYQNASCSDPLCSAAQSYGGACNGRTCKYKIPYDDPPAYTRGDLGFDTLSISEVDGQPRPIARFAFGCSHESRGPYNFAGAGGIAGFGEGKLSLPSQLGVMKFSYCFPRIAMWSIAPLNTSLLRSASSLSGRLAAQPSAPRTLVPRFSSLRLGEDATLGDDPDIQSTRILVSDEDSGYNVELQGISVGGSRLSISRSVFRRGGTIIDSGTTFTTLAPQAFHAVYAAFAARIALMPTRAASPRNLTLCYPTLPAQLPSLSFHFRGAQVHLPPSNYFIHIDDLFCLALVESRDSRSVYGNVQQQDFHILYDLHARRISFKPTSCFAPHT